MLNIYTTKDTGSLVIWPESASNSRGSYELELTHDMNLVSSSFPVYKINSPNNLAEYLVLQYYSGSGIPTASGQYSYNLDEIVFETTASFTYGSASIQWLNAQFRWDMVVTSTTESIGEGRVEVFGTNDAEFTKYTSPNEQGEYITYYTG